MSANIGRLAATGPEAPAVSTSETAVRAAPPAGLREALDGLAAELRALGWAAQVRTLPGRQPAVRAGNPEPGASALSEDIYARPGPGGGWEYCWPWAQPIASDPATAAAVIVRVLRSAGTP
jgi:hypothetical protein